MVLLTEGPIDVAALRAAVTAPRFGAVLVFEGVARDTFEGRRVTHLAYEAWAPVALETLEAIRQEAETRWGCALALAHRTGEVPVTEASVVIAVGAPHRAECYEASRFAIDTLKERVPIWKKEHYEDGSAWKANAPAGDR